MMDLNIIGNPVNRAMALTINGTAIDGLGKLLQRVMLTLFTDAESLYSMGNGTSLATELYGRNIAEDDVASNLFNIACAEAKRVVQAATPAGVPTDEQLKDLSATVLRGNRGELIVEIRIRSVADGTIAVKVPIPIIQEQLRWRRLQLRNSNVLLPSCSRS